MSGYEQHFAEGDVIMEAGSQGDRIYLIRAGRVLVSRPVKQGSSLPIEELGEGDVFGIHSILEKRQRSATVTALSDVTVRVYFEETFMKALEELTPTQKALFKAMVYHLEALTDSVINQKIKMAFFDKAQMSEEVLPESQEEESQ